jgi:hypothetical protein
MSSPHPTLTAWTRDEHDGRYRAELHDWKLWVSWTPNTGGVRGSFGWKAERDGKEHVGEGTFEELELAMAAAEAYAAADAKKRSARLTAKEPAGDEE